MKSISVFCGSSAGNDERIRSTATRVGEKLALQKIKLIYGGGSIGLMGIVADAVLANGGQVVGVIPEFLNSKEVAHPRLTELIVVKNMHERKAKMFELSEGFLALPGGFGTLEEIIEVLTWRQLRLHGFAVAFLNLDGFYEPLKELFRVMEGKGLLRPENRNLALFETDIGTLLEKMACALQS